MAAPIPARTTVSIPISSDFADELPDDPADRQRVLELGLREWRIRRSLDAFARGEGSLAHAAKRVGLSLRELIPLAYAHGLEPRVDAEAVTGPLTLEQASKL